jgi:integrase
VDLDAGVVTIERQLDRARLVGEAAGVEPVFGPTKTKRTRTVMLGEETLARLRAHKKAQAELKMKNRRVYEDHALVFGREPEDLQTPTHKLGQPLTTLSGRRFQALAKEADVKRIKFHGCRHTVATLSLQAGTPPHAVAARLGHSVLELMKTYAHALPDQQQDTATRLGRLLHG